MSENGKTMTLAVKLAKARSAVQGIEKKGRNRQQGYDYVRAEDVVIAAEKALGENSILVLPGVGMVKEERIKTKQGGEALLVQVTLDYQVLDAESGESISKPWVGYGYDTPGDKAIYKALTGANKYFLAALLGISFGDDPEADASTDQPVQTNNSASATTAASEKQVPAARKALKASSLSTEAQEAIWKWGLTAPKPDGKGNTLGRPAADAILDAAHSDRPDLELAKLARRAGASNSDVPPPDTDGLEEVPDETVPGDAEKVEF